MGLLFQCLNELIDLYSCKFEIDGKRLGAFLPKQFFVTVKQSMKFSILACAGVMEKVVSGLTVFSPAVMIASSSLNWSSVMNPYCLVVLVDAIG